MKKKHAEVIIAWANGAEIQHRAPNSTEWKDNADPAWVTDYDYRVKPAREEKPKHGYEKRDTIPESEIVEFLWFRAVKK